MTAADVLVDAWAAWDRHPAWPHAVAGYQDALDAWAPTVGLTPAEARTAIAAHARAQRAVVGAGVELERSAILRAVAGGRAVEVAA